MVCVTMFCMTLVSGRDGFRTPKYRNVPASRHTGTGIAKNIITKVTIIGR